MSDLCRKLYEAGFGDKLKILFYASTDYPGYSYIKIYNKNATKENMLDYLKKDLKLKKTVTFGTIPNRYTYTIEPGDSNAVVKQMKKEYEPLAVFAKNK